MLVKATNPFRRRGGRASRPSGLVPPPATVTILSVVAADTHLVKWTFSGPATTDGSGIPQLVIDTPDGPEAPVESSQGTANEVICNYDNGECAAGEHWHIDDTP